MSLTVVYSDTDLNQALLMSRLSGNPALVSGDIFAWNGILVDRATAVVALLKIYSQLPVGTQAKEKLFSHYTKRFSNDNTNFIVKDDEGRIEVWFYKLCKKIQGDIKTRSELEIKQCLILLHSL